MFLNNYHYFKNKETQTLILLILFSVLIRIPIIFLFGDSALENEWGIIVNNLIEHEKFSFRNFGEFFLPNLYMPPLYAYYLYSFSFFGLDNPNYILFILFSQLLISSVAVAIFYKINKIFFSQKISFCSSLLLSFFPIYLYSCSQISSVSLQTFLAILFFYFFFQLLKKKNILSIFLVSFIGGLLILLRGEFVVILIVSYLYLFIIFRLSIKKILLIFLITLITISPYMIRNVIIFKTFTITKSSGYNLWKGNNPNSKVEGSEFIDINLQYKIDEIPKDKYYQINFDNVFLHQAIENILEEPTRYLLLFGKKIASFLFIDINSSQVNYYNPLHYFPVLLLGITSTIGIFLSNKKSQQLNYLILIFFIYVIIFSSFFILPRYKMAIIPLQIIFTNVFIEYVYNKFKPL